MRLIPVDDSAGDVFFERLAAFWGMRVAWVKEHYNPKESLCGHRIPPCTLERLRAHEVPSPIGCARYGAPRWAASDHEHRRLCAPCFLRYCRARLKKHGLRYRDE